MPQKQPQRNIGKKKSTEPLPDASALQRQQQQSRIDIPVGQADARAKKKSQQNGKKTGQAQASRRITRSEARRRRRNRRILTIVLLLFTIGAGFLLSVTVLFPIQDFRIDGESIYTQEELVMAFDHSEGDNIFRFDIEKTQQAMAKQLPYLETIKVRRRLPGTVVFIIEPAVETYYLNAGTTNIILSRSLKILRLADIPPEGLCQITGVQVGEVNTLGTPFSASEQEQQDLLVNLINNVSYWFPEGVTAIDISSSLEMNFTYQNRLVVKLGTSSKLDYKLEMVAATIAEKLTLEEKGTLDASYAGKVFFSASEI